MWRMVDILFGWSKASKCKKLVKALQCRLKLLKNKRASVVDQLREDVAQLLKLGLHQIAFQRVEHLIKDKRKFEAYDLMDKYCEFIIIHFHYIRKHKDCPNDINEAVSNLIFSSTRFGELPELRSIRKLFGERYGQRFVTTAVELLLGNLVDNKMKEMVCTLDIPNDVKYRTMEEIHYSYVQSRQHFFKYKTELQEVELVQQATKCMDKYATQHLRSGGEDSEMDKSTAQDDESTSETLSRPPPEETIYLNNIQEFVSPLSKYQHLQDQRVFIFTSFFLPLNEITQHRIDKRSEKAQKSINTSSMSIGCASEVHHQALEWTDKILAHEGVITVPAEGSVKDHKDNNLRSNSVDDKLGYAALCWHTHPKLPDYDELAAKFTAIKRQNMQQNKQNLDKHLSL